MRAWAVGAKAIGPRTPPMRHFGVTAVARSLVLAHSAFESISGPVGFNVLIILGALMFYNLRFTDVATLARLLVTPFASIRGPSDFNNSPSSRRFAISIFTYFIILSHLSGDGGGGGYY